MEQQSSENPQQPSLSTEAPQETPRSNHHAKVKILLAFAVLALIAAGLIIVLFTGKKDDTPKHENNATGQTSQDDFASQYLQNCKERTVSFTKTPVPLDQMGYLEPMGKMSDGHVTPTDHVYVAPLSMRAADNTTDVVMPADGTVISIQAMPSQYIGDRQDQKTATEDHRLVIAHNCRYVSIFIHVHKLSDALKSALGGVAVEPNTQKSVAIELKAGDKLGTIGGNPVDWSLMDADHKLSGYITPSLYSGESWKVHVIDPVSVYTGDVQKQFIQKSLRSSEPYGGKIDYDKKGALVGNWFLDGTKGYSGDNSNGGSRYWDGHLAIVPDYIDPTATVVSMGNWQGKAAQYIARNATDPASVTQKSGPVKYELVQTAYVKADGQHWSPDTLPGKGLRINTTNMPLIGTVLVEVQANEKLKIEHFPGKSAAEVTGFTNKFQTYYR